MKTTIQLSKPTLQRLAAHKKHAKESYDEILNQILDAYEDEPLTKQEIDEIKQGLDDISKGKTRKIQEVAKSLGVKL